MVSKAVEIYIQGKLLKPAGKHIYCTHTHNQNKMWPNIYLLKMGSAYQEGHQKALTKTK